MEAGVEELKLLQTAILLITTDSVVQHDALAKVRVNPSSVVLRRCEQCQAPRVWCVCWSWSEFQCKSSSDVLVLTIGKDHPSYFLLRRVMGSLSSLSGCPTPPAHNWSGPTRPCHPLAVNSCDQTCCAKALLLYTVTDRVCIAGCGSVLSVALHERQHDHQHGGRHGAPTRQQHLRASHHRGLCPFSRWECLLEIVVLLSLDVLKRGNFKIVMRILNLQSLWNKYRKRNWNPAGNRRQSHCDRAQQTRIFSSRYRFSQCKMLVTLHTLAFCDTLFTTTAPYFSAISLTVFSVAIAEQMKKRKKKIWKESVVFVSELQLRKLQNFGLTFTNWWRNGNVLHHWGYSAVCWLRRICVSWWTRISLSGWSVWRRWRVLLDWSSWSRCSLHSPQYFWR